LYIFAAAEEDRQLDLRFRSVIVRRLLRAMVGVFIPVHCAAPSPPDGR